MPSKKFRIIHRIPNSNILIDYWKPVSQEKYHRFMTFLKIDTNDAIKEICESTYTIYTSLFNKWYLITYYQVSEHRLIDLRPDETRTIVDTPSGTSFSVTAFDANYYTGSLMFLFQGPFGNVLYTGFFRPCSLDSILRNPVLKSIIHKRELDVAYIDNTYAAEHCDFPTRKEVLNQIITCLKQHPNHQVSISGKRLGKEEILLEIAKALDEKIWVNEEKFVILSRLNVQNYFTTDKKKSRIYACDYIINPKQCMRKQAQGGAQIIILLTAYYRCRPIGAQEDINIPNLHIFPYSGHCSHAELKRFIYYLRPRGIQPIIKFEDDALPNSIIPSSLHELCSMPPPPTYSKYMECRSCKKDIKINRSSSTLNASTSSLDEAPEEKKIEATLSANVTISNQIEYLDNIDEFLQTVSESNNVSNFKSDTNSASVTLNTSDMPYPCSNIGDFSNSIIDDILATSHPGDVCLFENTTVSNRITVQNMQHSSPILSNPVPSNPVVSDNFQDVEIMQMLNQNDYPVAENITSVEFTATCSKPANENIVSPTSTTLDNVMRDGMDLAKVLISSPQSTAYSTNYAESEIAENIISSTNNENLSELNFPSPEEIMEKSNEDIETSVNKTNIDMNARIVPRDILKETCTIITPQDAENLEKEPAREPIPNPKTYDTKSIQTDLTGELITELLQQANPERRNITLMKQYMKNCVPKRKNARFDVDAYYETLNRTNIKDGYTCSVKDCEKVEELNPQIKKRKLINSALFKLTQKARPPERSIDENLSNLNGYGILSHPVYKC